MTLHDHPRAAQVAWFLSFFVLCHFLVFPMPSISFHQSHHSGPKPGVSVAGTVNLGEKVITAHCAARTQPDHCCITDPFRQGFSVQRTSTKSRLPFLNFCNTSGMTEIGCAVLQGTNPTPSRLPRLLFRFLLPLRPAIMANLKEPSAQLNKIEILSLCLSSSFHPVCLCD